MLLTFHLLLDRYNVFQYGFVVLAVLTLICYLTFVSSVFYWIMLYYCCCCCCSLYSIVSLLHAGMEKEKTKYPVPALQLVICLVYAGSLWINPHKVFYAARLFWSCNQLAVYCACLVLLPMSCFIAHSCWWEPARAVVNLRFECRAFQDFGMGCFADASFV